MTSDSPARMTAPPRSSIADTFSPSMTPPETTPTMGISKVKGMT